MNKIVFKKGESVTIGFLLNSEYDMSRIQSASAWVGGKKFALATIDHMLRCELASDETHKLSGNYKLNLWIDDSTLGVKKTYAADIEISTNNSNDNNDSINEGYDFVFNITINETAIQAGDVLYNYVKGDNADLPVGIVIDTNYVHTDNNYDDAAVLEVAKIAGKANSADVYTKSETYTKTEINNKLSAVYKFKSSVDYYSQLPLIHENGDTYNVRYNDDGTANGANYAWSDDLNDWDSLGGIVGLATLTENGLMSKEDFKKLSDLYTKEDLDLILANKSDVGHNHSGEEINPDAIVLDKAYTDLEMAALPVGAIFYNIDQLCWLLKLSAVNYYNFGEELPMLSMIGDDQNHLEGQAGYISGGQAGINKISLASSATGKINCLATQDVINTGNKRGYYAYFGQVRQFPYSNVIKSTDNENTWVDGADLFLSSEAGRYTTTQEDAPAKSSYIGRITNRQGANITVMFAPQISIPLEDLSNVDGAATTVASGDSFFIKAGNLWKTITESNFLSWFIGLSHTFTQLITFSGNLKTTKIIPNSDTTGVVIRNAADSADRFSVLQNKIQFRASNNQPMVELFHSGNNNGLTIVNNGGAVENTEFRQASNLGKFSFINNNGSVILFNLLANGDSCTRSGKYIYNDASPTADTKNDIRTFNDNGVFTIQKCTVASATKGGGTWVTTFTA